MTPTIGNHSTTAEPKAKGRHGGEARTWTYSHGLPPHTVYARELELGGIIQVRYTDPSKDGRDKRVRKHLDMTVRKAPDAEVDPKLEKKVQARIIAANGRLVAGLPAFDEPARRRPPSSTSPRSRRRRR